MHLYTCTFKLCDKKQRKRNVFQIRIFNPLFETIAARIKFNGESSSSMLVIRPGEDVTIDRFLDDKQKMLFETYNIKEVIFRLEQAGFSIAKPGAENFYRKNVYFLDPDGIEVEFVEYSSDLPSERNNED